MASEAQRLIGISLTKIAQSRAHRGGVSLHKNLLVATVLQKARYIFMEEAYNMVHYQVPTTVHARNNCQEDLVGLTAEEAGIESMPILETVREGAASSHLQSVQQACVKCSEYQDKENQTPCTSGELTYLDLDKTSNTLRERTNACLKRRRAIADWETEEAVQSILPKRSRCTEEGDDSVFLDEATILSDAVSKELETHRNQETTNSGAAMEIDRITSLVSIFSFGIGEGKLSRSVSTPDLCSAQAKDVGGDSLQQQRPFIAMTV